MSKYQVSANSTTLGIFEADDEQAARDLCAQEAGYKSEEDMEQQLECRSELVVDDLDRYVSEWTAWCEYIDPDGTVSRAEWDAMTEAQRMDLVMAVVQ